MRDEKRAEKIIELVKKEGEQKIYPGVYVTTGSDILDLKSDEFPVPAAGWTWEEIDKDEFYVYDDAGCVFEVFNNSFEFLDEDYEKDDNE